MLNATTLRNQMSAKQLPEKAKLKVVQRKLEEIVELIDGNQYQDYLYSSLITMKIEIERQLSNYE